MFDKILSYNISRPVSYIFIIIAGIKHLIHVEPASVLVTIAFAIFFGLDAFKEDYLDSL